jgi:putative transposase
MPNYRRDYGGTVWFLTVVTKDRRRILTSIEARFALRAATEECRSQFPFRIDAWVLLLDHFHAIWTLPEADKNYSRRVSIVKRRFTQLAREHGLSALNERLPDGKESFWQPRFWAHRIDDEGDYKRHVDYIHINPVKHSLGTRVIDWPWSSFHRFVADGIYTADWGGEVVLPNSVGRE